MELGKAKIEDTTDTFKLTFQYGGNTFSGKAVGEEREALGKFMPMSIHASLIEWLARQKELPERVEVDMPSTAYCMSFEDFLGFAGRVVSQTLGVCIKTCRATAERSRRE